jgi:hypothetical protein
MDVRVPLSDNASVSYAATWVHVPVDTELDFQFQGGSAFSYSRWYLNGELINGLKFDNKKFARRPVATRKLTLKAGWNQTFVCAYCTAYTPVSVGLIFDGPPQKLTTLSLSAKPPIP